MPYPPVSIDPEHKKGKKPTYTKDAQHGIRNNFEPMPVRAILGLVQNKFAGTKGIKRLQ